LKASWFPEGHKEVEINDDEAEGVTDGKKNKNKKKVKNS
jgi:hypothetical protein